MVALTAALCICDSTLTLNPEVSYRPEKDVTIPQVWGCLLVIETALFIKLYILGNINCADFVFD